MEDLAEKISELLSDPEIMSKLKNFTNTSESSDQNNTTEEENAESDFQFPSDIISTVMKLAPILSSMQKEDKHTKFLKALKPLLSEERQQKLDSCEKIMKLIKILPFLKNQGLF